MMSRRGVGGRGTIINKVLQTLAQDEHLMRLLVYPYQDENNEFIDCLDPDLPNIVGSDMHHEYIQHHFSKTLKQNDINLIKTSKIFIHLGRKHSIFNNHLLSKQELIVDVVTHIDFEDYDARLSDILDRVDQLLVHENITMGKADISTPIPYEAQREYYRYQLKYLVWVRKS